MMVIVIGDWWSPVALPFDCNIIVTLISSSVTAGPPPGIQHDGHDDHDDYDQDVDDRDDDDHDVDDHDDCNDLINCNVSHLPMLDTADVAEFDMPAKETRPPVCDHHDHN